MIEKIGRMIVSGDPLRFGPDPNEWAHHWQNCEFEPNHNGPVWGYCPDLKEEPDDPDDPGMVQIVRYAINEGSPWGPGLWKLAHGDEIVRVTKWAEINYPEFPVGIELTSVEAGERNLAENNGKQHD